MILDLRGGGTFSCDRVVEVGSRADMKMTSIPGGIERFLLSSSFHFPEYIFEETLNSSSLQGEHGERLVCFYLFILFDFYEFCS